MRDNDDIDDIRQLYQASRSEQSPDHLDKAITAAAQAAATQRRQKKTSLFDPPMAIAATLLLTVGLVTLVIHDIGHSPVTENFQEDITAKQTQAAAPAIQTAAPLAMGSPQPAAPPEKREHSLSPKQDSLAIQAPLEEAGLATPLEQNRSRVMTKTHEPQASGAIPINPQHPIKQTNQASDMNLADIDTPTAFSGLDGSREKMRPSAQSRKHAEHLTPSKGYIRTIAGKMQVWYDGNRHWVSPEHYFDLEIDRLGGLTYGQIKDEYPPYETVREWETLIDILPDGRQCPMVFFHQRWRRLPDVLGLDERLRNYDGCVDVFRY